MADYEVTILTIPQCFVYRVPPLASGSGYKAKDWDLQSPIWQGRLVVKTNRGMCVVRLLNNDGFEFAVCPVNTPNAVEKVLDSSRYFALRISDGSGKTAVIGLGFAERNAAFDFQAALHDQQKKQNQEKEIAAARTRRAQEPAIDYSLPAGKTIAIELKVKPSATGKVRPSARSRRRGGDDDDDDDDDDFALPPPPSAHGGAAGPLSSGGASLLVDAAPTAAAVGGAPAPRPDSGLDGLLDIPAVPAVPMMAAPGAFAPTAAPMMGAGFAPIGGFAPVAAAPMPMAGFAAAPPPTPAGAFGGLAPAASPFAAAPAPAGFGALSPSPAGLAAAPSPFGGASLAPAPSPFGGASLAPAPSPFGGASLAPAPSPFGGASLAPAPSPFGGASLAPAPSPFGGASLAPAPSPFGGASLAPTAAPTASAKPDPFAGAFGGLTLQASGNPPSNNNGLLGLF